MTAETLVDNILRVEALFLRQVIGVSRKMVSHLAEFLNSITYLGYEYLSKTIV